MIVDSPIFTIIIPTHNRAKLLPKAIESVLRQKYQNWELIIVDDGSTDNTKAVVHKYEDPRLRYIHQTAQERSVARNRGIDEAKGQYICFMDDDDYYLDHHLATFYEFLVKHNFPEWILRIGFYRKEREQFTPTGWYNSEKDGHPVKWAAFNFCSVCTLCIPKHAFEEDRFPESFTQWEDTHLILRLLAKYSFHQLKEYTYVYVQHSLMGSRKLFNQNRTIQIQRNVETILTFFDSYGHRVSQFLPPNTLHFLVGEKYLGHANKALNHYHFKISIHLMLKSLKYIRSRRLFKAYIRFVGKFCYQTLRYIVSEKDYDLRDAQYAPS